MADGPNAPPKDAPFAAAADYPWTATEPGVKRKVLSHGDGLMVVHVAFEAGAVGAVHQHPHLQCSFVESGVFDVTIGGETRRLKQGDTFFAPSMVPHGVVAVTAGRLVDSFTPRREEFL